MPLLLDYTHTRVTAGKRDNRTRLSHEKREGRFLNSQASSELHLHSSAQYSTLTPTTGCLPGNNLGKAEVVLLEVSRLWS